ncbi:MULTISPECIES: DUF5753 domain-containing protein [Streptomycetaceae]|uniref:DUF5753 domain-containing protein n=1 Tax=Streptomycetaceae TaxID=2062 RepID=UPI0009A1537F|nr:DUF5753 domain-containing protein [Streptomyces sp. CB02056]
MRYDRYADRIIHIRSIEGHSTHVDRERVGPDERDGPHRAEVVQPVADLPRGPGAEPTVEVGGLVRVQREQSESGPDADFLDLDSDARYIQTWQPLVLPGLLQTEDYARALLGAHPAAVRPERIDQLVKVRMERKSVLVKSEPTRFWAIIWEPALRCPVGGTNVQRAQLDYLVEAAQRPNVTLQVVPLDVGAVAGACGAFVMFGFTDSPNPGAVFLETLTSSHYLEQEAELDGHGLVFDYLRSSALNPAQSIDMITAIATGT